VENLHYDNLTMTGVRLPIIFTSYYVSKKGDISDPLKDDGTPNAEKTPIWRNITIRNLTATESPPSGVVGQIYGLPESPVSNVSLINVKIAGTHGLQLYNVRNLTCDSDTRLISADGPTFDKPHNAGILPAGFAQREIGGLKVSKKANATLFDPNIGMWTINCEGAGVTDAGDQLNYCSCLAAGNSTIIAQLSRIETAESSAATQPSVAQAGPMLRASDDPEAPFAALWQTSDGQLIFQWRAAAGQPVSSALPVPGITIDQTAVKLVRTPAGICAAYCPDQVNWNQIGTAVAIPALNGPDCMMGLAATGNSGGVASPAAFSHFQVLR
jgi:hypothetical protein